MCIMIYIETLGRVAVHLDGAAPPRPLTWRKNLALLVYLARSAARQRSREHLVGLLWGDKPDAAARHSLNEALSTIRRSAGADIITTDGDRVQLVDGVVALDVDELEQCVDGEDWTGAASLAKGVFLEGFSVPGASGFEDWMTAERASLRRVSVEALVHTAQNALLGGDLEAAQAAAERATALDPFSNLAVRANMKSIALRGERAAALGVYDRFVLYLQQELGVEPESETTHLADRVRRERTWRLPAVLAEAPGRSRRAPLIGRDQQLRAALDVWRRAVADSRCSAVIVEGDPGIGKTRLIEEIVARARLEGAVVAGIRAVAADRETPWSGVYGFARGGLLEAPGVGSAPPRSLATFTAHVPSWKDRFGTETEGVEPELPGRALSEIAGAVAEEQPLVLFVDDSEWLDGESALALIAILRDLAQSPCCVVLASPRHPLAEHFDELRSHLGREVMGDVIELHPVAEHEIGMLARHILPTFDDEQIDRIARRIEVDSAGLPLFAVELLDAVRLGLELGETPTGWPQPHKTLDETLPVDLPDSVVGSIRIGFRKLSAEAQQVLAAASVLDERVPNEVLESATGLAGDALFQALDELEWQRWLVAEPRGYGFLARIVRDVIARDMLTPGQRRRVRASIGSGEARS